MAACPPPDAIGIIKPDRRHDDLDNAGMKYYGYAPKPATLKPSFHPWVAIAVSGILSPTPKTPQNTCSAGFCFFRDTPILHIRIPGEGYPNNSLSSAANL